MRPATRRNPEPAAPPAQRRPGLEAALPAPLEGPALRAPVPDPADAARRWAESGAMALTGEPDAPPRFLAVDLVGRAQRVLALLSSLVPAERRGELGTIDAGALLGERAACLGLVRRGRTSAGAQARILRAADRFVAVSLPREDDWSLLPAWTEGAWEEDATAVANEDPEPGWERLAAVLRARDSGDWLERAALMGLAVAPASFPGRAREPAGGALPGVRASRSGWCWIESLGPLRSHPAHSPLVLDLSSLWAGPLCTQLLAACGARVVKLESTRRPDGARAGDPDFFDLLNAGKRSVALDFSSHDGLVQLRSLVDAADIVVEGSRPRALQQLGVDAMRFVRERPGRTWLSLTGYGRSGDDAQRVAFGDDAAAAAGLAQEAGGSAEAPVFCADAIADPLAGLHAALAAWSCHRAGGGRLVDLSLVSVARDARETSPRSAQAARLTGDDSRGWRFAQRGEQITVESPRARAAARRARALGEDTAALLSEISAAC